MDNSNAETRLQLIITREGSSIILEPSKTVYFSVRAEIVKELKSRGFDFQDKRKKKLIVIDEHLVTVDGKFGVFFELSSLQEIKAPPGGSQPVLSRFPASHSQLSRRLV